MLTLLHDLKTEKLISDLNYHFAKLIDSKQQAYAYTPLQQNLAVLLAAVMSFHVLQGHSCFHLNAPSARHFFGLKGRKGQRDFLAEIWQKIDHTEPLEWQTHLSDHIAFSHSPDQPAPLLFQHQSLYFYRYWQAENRIARYLHKAVNTPSERPDLALNKRILSRFFPEAQHDIDWQKVAVATALQQPFSLISGGPGTGKTRTVAMLLAALQLKQLELNLPLLQIALVAPTGKAAARLKESIADNLSKLTLPDSLKAAVPIQASTIHSFLGIRPLSDQPKHHAQNPVHDDLIVVDEASMIDLFVLEKLLNALKPHTRLILLGDKDQLASVEAGSTMNELGQFLQDGYSPRHSDYLNQVTGYALMPKKQRVPAICDSLCHLRYSHRFGSTSGIGQLASEINAQQAVKSWQLFATPRDDLHLHAYPPITEFADKHQWQQQCVQLVLNQAVMHYTDYLLAVKARLADPQAVAIPTIFAKFQKVRFLSALRISELGSERLNQQIADALQQAQLVQFKQRRETYFGKPILITENAPQQQIFSGDIGLALPDEHGKVQIYFETEMHGKPLQISPTRLPSHEPAYVMTVHKSQGSEFEHTLLIMPLTASPVVSKELLYTAVTRARQTFSLFSNEKVWKQGVNTDVQRQSGLSHQLHSLEMEMQNL